MNDPLPTTPDTRLQAIGKDILEHFRNLLMCATLLALGLLARRRSGDLLGGALIQGFIGWGVITVAAALALLNLWSGVNRLKQWKQWKLWSVVLLAAYLVIAMRVLEVMALVKLEGK
jgi:hypothetical protein